MKISWTAPLIITISAALFAACSPSAHATEFKQDVHYQVIENPDITSTPTFTEYFSFFALTAIDFQRPSPLSCVKHCQQT